MATTSGIGQKKNKLVTKVELRISANNLEKKDVTSKSDPVCCIFGYDSVNSKWIEVSNLI